MRSFLRTAGAFLRRDWLVQTSYRVNFVLNIGSTLASLFFLAFISEFVGERAAPRLEDYGGSYFAFLVIGVGMLSFLDTALTQASRRIREGQVLGTFEALLATRTGTPTILFCLPLYAFLETTLRFALYLALGALLFGLDLRGANLPAALAVFAAMLAAFASLGLVIAALTVAFKRAEPVASLISGLCLFLGGVYYPLDVLPPWLRAPASLLPITPALQGLRTALLSPTPTWSAVTPPILHLLLFIAILGPTGIYPFRWALRRAMRDGTLTQY